jgi:hypothetical protein
MSDKRLVAVIPGQANEVFHAQKTIFLHVSSLSTYYGLSGADLVWLNRGQGDRRRLEQGGLARRVRSHVDQSTSRG